MIHKGANFRLPKENPKGKYPPVYILSRHAHTDTFNKVYAHKHEIEAYAKKLFRVDPYIEHVLDDYSIDFVSIDFDREVVTVHYLEIEGGFSTTNEMTFHLWELTPQSKATEEDLL